MSKLSKIVKATLGDFDAWVEEIASNRVRQAGSSVSSFKFAKCRVRQLKGPNYFPELGGCSNENPSAFGEGGVVYWMIRDQRVEDNWAFLYAQRLALKFSVPLHVCFCLVPRYQADTLRHFAFMIGGLAEVEQKCNLLNIPFHLVQASEKLSPAQPGKKRTWSDIRNEGIGFCEDAVAKAVAAKVAELNVGCLVTDFCPLRQPCAWIDRLVTLMPEHIPVCQVDAHNVVPVWYASDKLEYAARTIRRKLHDRWSELMTEFPPIVRHPFGTNPVSKPSTIDLKQLENDYKGDVTVKPVAWAKPGTKAGLMTLYQFINTRLHLYDSLRNDPTKIATSDLSPWFHFGHVAPQRALLEVRKLRTVLPKSADAFIEEAFVRRELSDNFCHYNPNYDSLKGAYQWAQETLLLHERDKRNPAYTESEMEDAKTGDDLWNASQRQLIRTGKLHGFLRMYWAKKILEWHKDGPAAALKLALFLNDKYSLDGTDPNGFVGAMWSICGVHDQGWAERPIFGKIRCMTYNGCARKFSVPTFVTRYS
ncbi:Deoxyribodipyrimidine photo-lyase [Fasciolopsis buskii]|uniref:Deoxyribodipyrimidine photo-lyase n=1 Tax=Fasciolopsis buskii TaxID=27845 RepID=A0A8E0S4Y0_9TREM|nr:Deoxyribodipyrimidine photo-lyase [Fasciolopsis buski]